MIKLRTKQNLADNGLAEILHGASKKWISSLQFMHDELLFIDRLLNSYVFEPNTPNLFERLQEYLDKLKVVKQSQLDVQTRVIDHESTLSGILEFEQKQDASEFLEEHDQLEEVVEDCMYNFQFLKSEIFNYAGSILKQKKRKD